MSCHLTNHLGPCPLGTHDPLFKQTVRKKLFNTISFPCWAQGNLPYNKAMQHRADWEPCLAAGHLSYMPRVKSVQALKSTCSLMFTTNIARLQPRLIGWTCLCTAISIVLVLCIKASWQGCIDRQRLQRGSAWVYRFCIGCNGLWYLTWIDQQQALQMEKETRVCKAGGP